MITHIDTATVYVSDHEESRQFYCDVIGFSAVTDPDIGDDRWLEIAPRDGSTTIAVHDAATVGDSEPRRRGDRLGRATMWHVRLR